MTRLVLAAEFAEDVERIVAHLLAHDAERVGERVAEIFGALAILHQHPLIGRQAPLGRRDLIIGRDARGYVARYHDEAVDDAVVVLALRAQREAGFVDR